MNQLSYYLSLITSEYQSSPNFLAFLTILLQPFVDAGNLLTTVYTAYNINTAQGVQLDIIGQIVGQSRTVNFQPTNGGSPILDDVDYQTLLLAKVAINLWDGQIETLEPLWQVLYPNGDIIVHDNQDMTMNVIISGNLTMTQRDLVRNGYIVPRPEGVLINYYFGDEPFFAYDIENQYFAGYDTGNWAMINEPTTFAYDEANAQFGGYDTGYWSD
jgi:hypothetical protein